jgi:hypothetical protein
VLSRSFNNDALFAKVLTNGLHGDYLALIEKRNLAGLSYMKAGRVSYPSVSPEYFVDPVGMLVPLNALNFTASLW